MSLVVARRCGESIITVSDTHLTYPNLQKNVPPLKGVLKSFVVDHGFTVSFAGNPSYASEALQTFKYAWRTEESIDSVVNHFLHSHLASDKNVDYILGFGFPITALLQIKDGTVTNVQSAWIGDDKAFDVFQRSFHEKIQPYRLTHSYSYDCLSEPTHKDTQPGLLQRMMTAFQVVIEDPAIPTVKVYVVPIASYRDDIRYVEYLHAESATVDLESFGATAPLPIDGAHDGAYAICFFFADNGRSCHPTIYFYQGLFGVLYTPVRHGISQIYHEDSEEEASNSNIFIYRNPTIKGFIQQLRRETGLHIASRFEDETWLRAAIKGMFKKTRR